MKIKRLIEENAKEVFYVCLFLTSLYFCVVYWSVLGASLRSISQKLNTMTYANKASNRGNLIALKGQYCQGNLYPSDQVRIQAEINKILEIDESLIKEISETNIETGLVIKKISLGEYTCPKVN